MAVGRKTKTRFFRIRNWPKDRQAKGNGSGSGRAFFAADGLWDLHGCNGRSSPAKNDSVVDGLIDSTDTVTMGQFNDRGDVRNTSTRLTRGVVS